MKLRSQFDDEKSRLRRKKRSGDTISRIFLTDRGVLSVLLDVVSEGLAIDFQMALGKISFF